MKIIFLDIDGVLNRHDKQENGYCGTLPRCVSQLNRIIRRTDAHLVISSSWRYLVDVKSMTRLGFENLLLSHGVICKCRLHGITVRDEVIPDRGDQIQQYIKQYYITKYVVLDDGGDEVHAPATKPLTESLNEFHYNNWVKVGELGLTAAYADKAIRILS